MFHIGCYVATVGIDFINFPAQDWSFLTEHQEMLRTQIPPRRPDPCCVTGSDKLFVYKWGYLKCSKVSNLC